MAILASLQHSYREHAPQSRGIRSKSVCIPMTLGLLGLSREAGMHCHCTEILRWRGTLQTSARLRAPEVTDNGSQIGLKEPPVILHRRI